MTEWFINYVPLRSLGFTIAGGQMRTHGVSSLRLQRAGNFDAAEALTHNLPVVVSFKENFGTEDEGPHVTYFRGKVVTVPRYASGPEEGQMYAIEDAWAELESTTYQESWGFGVIAEEDPEAEEPANIHLRENRMVPRFVFGMNADGERITVAQQIRLAILYAASQGVAIQMGTVPTAAEFPTPSELTNTSCAEIVRMSIKLHPDWFPVIDHTTNPPTFHVRRVAAMDQVAFPADGTGLLTDFEAVERLDLLPAAVRVVYDFAGEANVDGEPQIFRKAVVDKFPLDGPDGGPKVIVAAIPLQGMQMQTQKSRIQARTIPVPGETSSTAAKEWVKAHYLSLKDVPIEEFTITSFGRELIAEPDDHAPVINPRAVRLGSDDVDDYPRELVRGSIEDWMRVRVRPMLITPVITISPTAGAAARAAAAKGFPPFTVTATNARTKTYHGATQWVAPEQIPTGVAEAVYNAVHDACKWDGTIIIEAEEIPLTNYLAHRVSITETEDGGLATMDAPVYSVDWDIQTGQATLSFGMVETLGPVDFLELQRLFRQLPVKWWSASERTSDKIGSPDEPSAAGDTVSGYDIPQTIYEPSTGGSGAPCPFGTLVGNQILGGPVRIGNSNWEPANFTIPTVVEGERLVYLRCNNVVPRTDDDVTIITPGLISGDMPTWEVTSGSSLPDDVPPEFPGDWGITHVPIGRLIYLDSIATFQAAGCGGIIIGQCGGEFTYRRANEA